MSLILILEILQSPEILISLLYPIIILLQTISGRNYVKFYFNNIVLTDGIYNFYYPLNFVIR